MCNDDESVKCEICDEEIHCYKCKEFIILSETEEYNFCEGCYEQVYRQIIITLQEMKDDHKDSNNNDDEENE